MSTHDRSDPAGEAWRGRVRDIAELVLDMAAGRPATLGDAGRLVCVDGPAGSGKSTLGEALTEMAQSPRARLLRTDDVLGGWDGLPRLGTEIERDLLRPLSRGHAGRLRRYDWATARREDWETVPPPVDLLCLEGVGSWAARYADLVTVLVWVELPEELRRRRAAHRDRDLSWWDSWARDEQLLHRREGTREYADVRIDGDEYELTVVLG